MSAESKEREVAPVGLVTRAVDENSAAVFGMRKFGCMNAARRLAKDFEIAMTAEETMILFFCAVVCFIAYEDKERTMIQ